ncbi:sulfatase [Cellulomonas sp. PhB143]|uniref:sulfatase family protein n=1 Tax=Cellulomonas sp. PhB143 TaxID=2485186 RepID=UPI000F47F112|nr:sulfatase [Cellulomonas sp. PhB143]ROS75395.1 arylsulfatase A-like enzyme [Cellulomonas sp. PhB143]
MTSSGTAGRPNVVLVLTDDHASHAIGAYGSPVARTPHLDALAASGARLDRCFATNSLCAPSRASLLTGTYSHVNGVSTLLTPIDASQPTFVSQLRAAGYRTAIVGKWHMGDGPGHDPEGFDHWDVLIDQGEYLDPTFRSAAGLRTETGYATEVITDLALAWLDSVDADGGGPWCVLVWHKAPHRPWVPDPRREVRALPDLPVPETFFDDHAGRSDSVRRAEMSIAEHLTATDLKRPVPDGLSAPEQAAWRYRRFMEDYLACVESVDDGVGRIAGWLADRGLTDETLLMYASDQGFFLGDHGWFDKRLMFEESIRMPFLVSCPGRVPAGSVLGDIVTNVDVARTVLEAAGVEAHPRMQGRSFWPRLVGPGDGHGPDGPEPEGMYYRYWEHDDVDHHAPAHYGYRTATHKLVYYYNDGLGIPGTSPHVHPPEWELYDLVEDPRELVDVSDDPAYADVRAELERAMWREQARVGDRPHPSQARPAGV